LPGDQPPSEGNFARHISDTLKTSDSFQVVSLEKEAERVGLSVADQLRMRDQALREWLANKVMPSFLWANGLALGAIVLLVALDEINIYFRLAAPGDRIVSSQVIMTLLGATTVQVGVIAAIIARYLFPGRSVE
jgi:CRISPR/Cas system-associated protein Csm6